VSLTSAIDLSFLLIIRSAYPASNGEPEAVAAVCRYSMARCFDASRLFAPARAVLTRRRLQKLLLLYYIKNTTKTI